MGVLTEVVEVDGKYRVMHFPLRIEVKHPDGESVHQFDSTESIRVELASSAGVTVYVLEEDEVVEVDDDHVAVEARILIDAPKLARTIAAIGALTFLVCLELVQRC